MCKILLSINPVHVSNIFKGFKKYEFRKIECKEKVDKIVIYSTYPVMKVVGEANMEDVIVDKPSDLWEKVEAQSGITKDFYDRYYKGRQKAVAFKLGNVVKYDKPKSLSSLGIKSAPQSFIYMR